MTTIAECLMCEHPQSNKDTWGRISNGADLCRVGHRCVNRLGSSELLLGVGVVSPLTLALLDRLLPVRRSTTLRGTLSGNPLRLQCTQSLREP